MPRGRGRPYGRGPAPAFPQRHGRQTDTTPPTPTPDTIGVGWYHPDNRHRYRATNARAYSIDNATTYRADSRRKYEAT